MGPWMALWLWMDAMMVDCAWQAGALVHIYTDGSVLLTHGGTEMGQGLHTKMIQVCFIARNDVM